MATLRAFSILAILVVAAAAQAEETASSNQGEDLRPEFPLIVRIDDRALEPLRSKDVRHEAPVDRTVLGTRAIGRSWTTGAIDVQMMPERDDASFAIRFRGRSQTQSTGHNGPALIYNRTFTDFDCARCVVFEPRTGFVAGPTVIRSKTTLVYDGFASSRKGLGRRIIARIAQRRAGESHAQALAIAQRDNEAAILQNFDKRLDEQMVAINRQLDIARYVNALFGPKSKPHLAARTCQDCLLIGIGNEKSPRRLVTFPPEREKPAPIELWVHSSMLGTRMARLATIMDRFDSTLLPAASRFEVLQLILGNGQTQAPIDVEFHRGWMVIGFQNEAPDPGTLAIVMAVDYAARRLPPPVADPSTRVAATESGPMQPAPSVGR